MERYVKPTTLEPAKLSLPLKLYNFRYRAWVIPFAIVGGPIVFVLFVVYAVGSLLWLQDLIPPVFVFFLLFFWAMTFARLVCYPPSVIEFLPEGVRVTSGIIGRISTTYAYDQFDYLSLWQDKVSVFVTFSNIDGWLRVFRFLFMRRYEETKALLVFKNKEQRLVFDFPENAESNEFLNSLGRTIGISAKSSYDLNHFVHADPM